MDERLDFAERSLLPRAMMMEVSAIYTEIAQRITGRPITISDTPRDDIVRVLREQLGIIDQHHGE